jgi:hypothetical protein
MASLAGAPIDATTAKSDARELSVASGSKWPLCTVLGYVQSRDAVWMQAA